LYEYTGAIHIHSVYSDGTGKIEEIAQAAADSNLDFIMMTDHNTLKPKEDGHEKIINGVMVVIGYELNDINNKNHYLVFGIDEVIGSFQVLDNGELGSKLHAKDYVRIIKEKNGIGFLAHPDEERRISKGHVAYPWTQWDTNDFHGIEIWNHMSEWIEGMNENNQMQRFLHPLKSIISPPAKTLTRWDIIAQHRPVTGIGGVDAHAFKQNLMGFFEVEIFPYKVLFKSIRTHVLLNKEINVKSQEDFEKNKSSILDALKLGRCFTANYYHGDAKGFRFFADCNKEVYNMGETIECKQGENPILHIFVPKLCEIRLIYNGVKIASDKNMQLTFDAKKQGVYRVECWKENKGWIFSNHIRVNIIE
jgi:hypothetical protein